jgi:LacI family transcriptional regulator
MATIHDVAQDAGVSPTTVSRYLNNRIELPATTSARIDAAIQKLDYRPNILAKRLSTGKTEAIGLVTPDIREPFFAELASAVEDEADRHGYTIFMASTRSDRAREIAAINRLHDRHVDGLIMMTNTPDDGTLAKLIGRRRNVVLVDEDIPGVNVPRVFVENEAGAREATQHLIEAGHRSIGFIGGPAGLFSTREREAGFRRALQEAGIATRDELVRIGSFSPDFAKDAVEEFLAMDEPPTAIFASSDCLVIGSVRGLRNAGVSVPDEISLVGFDDVPMTDLLQPPLTSVRQPIEALGRQGFLALFALLNGKQPAMLTRLPVELIRRGSVASPRKGDLRR